MIKISTKTQEKIVKQKINKIKKPSIIIPEGLSPVKLNVVRTSDIGSVDSPTIDGGVLNADDGLPIINYQSNTAKNVPQEPAPAHQIAPMKKIKPFEDSWARSAEVKSVLNKAIQNGKLDYVMSESTRRGLPASVAIIPIVESHYSEQAVSPKGAAGIWQLMPSLAKDYHLEDSERFDFKKSTQIAFNHIEQLYGQFGNWELAFAAYNAGNKRVTDALHRNPNAKSVDELSLPLETKLYLTKIKLINQALLNVR
jgi:hypothetical protein